MSSKKDGPTEPVDPLKEDPSIVADEAEFPEPSLYFKVFESEEDEPEAKIRADVNKLYDRWIEKYGRRWPEDGINTEDMVWIAEEAEKGKSRFPRPGPTGARPAEQSEVEDEFVPESDDGTSPAAATASDKAGDAPGGAAAAPGSRRPRTNYEKTVAGGKWVTDEFESADYEAGNLEHLWNMYLWDREGKPTMMPDTPAAQQEGEESEDWDDFYTAYRPRDVDTEEAREAVWATDEFESDEDNTESEWAPEYVGAGLGLVAEDPLNPQYSLRHSTHPLAPFPGEALKWSSYVYPDFTTYEGLTKQSIPHGMGVMTFGTGTGAGFPMNQTRYGDRYEGEFQAGYAHGLGQFTSETSGEVFVGEFFAGQRHGCGLRLNMKPYFYLLERGVDPVEAYKRTAGSIMRDLEVRTWYRGNKLGDAKEDEVVELAVLAEEADHPFEVALRNATHDAKLRRWVAMTPREKAMDRVVSIVERVKARNPRRFGEDAYYYEDEKGRMRPARAENGGDTDYDSVDMLQGVDTDGELGLGWDGATDSSENPADPRLFELAVAEGYDDKIEDEGFKESVLGAAIVNPFTGLDLKTYLDGKEAHQADLVSVYRHSRSGRAAANAARREGGLPPLPEEAEATEYWEERAAAVERADEQRLAALYAKAGVTAGQVARGEELIARWHRLLAEDEPLLRPASMPRPGRNPLANDDTDTGFETESDMMEMCDTAEILGTVQEAQQIVERARMWRFKPYGEVTIRMAQDANGSPVNLMQDPLHYPHGTKFMAPGPLGLCHPLPNDPSLRAEMAKVAANYAAVYRAYNFDWDPEPGSVQYAIDQRIRRAAELRGNALARYLEAADEALAEPAEGEGDQALMALASAPAPGLETAGPSPRRVVLPAGGPFASVSMGMTRGSATRGSAGAVRLGHAARAVLGAFAAAARQVPMARPRLARPGRGGGRGAAAVQEVQ